jgi:hypothetical protein
MNWRSGPLRTTSPVVGVALSIQLAGSSGPGVGLDFATSTNAGTYIGAITVTTVSGGAYSGIITIGGTDAAKFSLSASSNVLSATYPVNLYVSQTDLPAGSYSISLSANP